MFLFSAALFGSQPYWSLFLQSFWRFTPLQGGLAPECVEEFLRTSF
ncbi:hypothetical protein DHBDCA_p1196 [Dehalobacter sp. DCA]|nr:hypothetical protein DHBDCA_p1196 [Dehalobacter sp. DCA]